MFLKDHMLIKFLLSYHCFDIDNYAKVNQFTLGIFKVARF